jgi:hypothetical protein
MKKISVWAKKHKRLSWLIITLINIGVYLCAISVGALLDQTGIHLNVTFLLLILLVIMISLLIYPLITNDQKHYTFKKGIEFTVGMAVFFCICFLYNTNNRFYAMHTYNNLQGSFSVQKKYTSKDSINTSTHYFSKKEIRQEKRKFRSMFFKKEQSNEKSTGTKILLTLLICLGAIVGIAAVATLGCAISCGGAEALGLIIAILGLAGVIWLIIIGLSRVYRKKEITSKTAPIEK